MVKITVYATDLAIILGFNTYKNISDIFIKLYEKHFPTECSKLIEKMHEDGYQLIPHKTSEETIRENKLDISGCKNSKSATELTDNKKSLMKTIESNKKMTMEKKQELKDAVQNVGNTHFGIKNENGVIDYYCKTYEKKMKPVSGFKFKNAPQFVSANRKYQWNIGGKVDGITEDGILIEIKNRVNKLFGTLRDYERVQLQTYLYLYNLKVGHLVEGIIKEDGSIGMNAIEDKFNEELWNDLMQDLKIFAEIFEKSICDDNFMKSFLLESVEMRNTILGRLIQQRKESSSS